MDLAWTAERFSRTVLIAVLIAGSGSALLRLVAHQYDPELIERLRQTALALLLMMASGIISGFNVLGFWSAVFGALLISVVSWLINGFIGEHGTVEYIDLRHRGGNRWE